MKVETGNECERFLRFYTEMFVGRPTRLGVLETAKGTTIDYWIEDGLPLVGIDLSIEKDRPSIQIMVGDLSHCISDAKNLTAYFPADATENGLDIVDAKGNTTILRFETQEITESRV